MIKSLVVFCFLLASATSMNLGLRELENEILEDILKDAKIENGADFVNMEADNMKTGFGELEEENKKEIFKDVYIDKGKLNLDDEPYVENDGNQCSGDSCYRNSILRINQCLVSTNHAYQLCMQSDGNLVIYCMGGGKSRATWATGTDGHAVRDGLYFQKDGNLVLYNYANKALWSSGTHNTEAHRLVMQGDGNLVVYGYYQTVFWSSGTWGKC